MRKLKVFESVTVNGFFCGPGGDMSWAHAHSGSAEFQAFVEGNAAGAATLLFGRVTYQMMASYWPTPLALKNSPRVAKGMNDARKLVFSRTLSELGWANATLVSGELPEAVRALKREGDQDLVVLGSGSIVAQLAEAGLVDEYQLVIKPTAIGQGRTLLGGLGRTLDLKLHSSRAFDDGNLVLSYQPAS
jgi:dihydrofolate reductase